MEPAASLQDTYQKKEHIQHIYDLPDTYTGSVEWTEGELFVVDKEKTHFVCENVSYVPGLFKIFDEILVNAVDHKQRDSSMKGIKVTFAMGVAEISVWNDGNGIDVEKHPVYGEYIVEMLFGQLLTSSNYEKDRKRIVGGKNGYGAKLTNIFSKKFKVETVDAVRQKKYVQTFWDNMTRRDEPIVTRFVGKPYTMVTFLPDYTKFGCDQGITEGIYKVFEKRVYDVAGTAGGDGAVQVHLNGEKIPVRGFEKYVSMYFPDTPKFFDQQQERWKVALCVAPSGQGFTQVSFVNNVWTHKGGKHVDHVVAQITDAIRDSVGKHPKLRDAVVKPGQIKELLCVFVSSTIENPSFTSQTKEELTSRVSDFGSKYTLGGKMVERLLKSGLIVERLAQGTQTSLQRSIKKTDGSKRTLLFVPKLEDANYAGTKKSEQCTLILTEGDSAKTSALAGLSVHGPTFRDYFGVFPLKGKLLNVRDASAAQVIGNEEITNLKKILGLQQGKEYTAENIRELRYGSVSLMTDQDSVTGDTPILVGRVNRLTGRMENSVAYIQDLFDELCYFTLENGKQVSYVQEDEDFYVWTARGFTPVRKVIRHRTSKRIYRIISSRGIVDVSEDHSLLDSDENCLTPKDLQADLGRKLLYSFPFEPSEQEVEKACTFYEHSKYNAQVRYLLETIKGHRVRLSWDAVHLCYVLETGESDGKEQEEKGESERGTKVEEVTSEYVGQYIYDLETENHQFQAGIGELIVHNTDGSHIKGLVINFFDHFFPSLLRVEGFLKSFVTPIVRGFKRNQATKDFYTLQDFAAFRETEHSRGYEFKYYKGLGTSSSQEMQGYFRRMSDITVKYEYDPDTHENIELAFRRTLASERKDWLKVYDANDTIQYKVMSASGGAGEADAKKGYSSGARRDKQGKKKRDKTKESGGGELEDSLAPPTTGDVSTATAVSISDFVHKDLKHFSNSDNIRSIPNLMDGLKPSQRKVIYGALKKCGAAAGQRGGSNSTTVKVAQLSGYISEQTSYHHGEASLEQTIVSMAQKFVGKNNVNWLEPVGMFGTRLMGGKDHASARYIFTTVSDMARQTFRSEDNALLEYETDDGDLVEPREYYPVVPTVLLNGCEGIGTGYSTFIPMFDPMQVASECENFARGQPVTKEWTPWYDGFQGRVVPATPAPAEQEVSGSDRQNFLTVGVLKIVTDGDEAGEAEGNSGMGRLLVTELPVGLWTDHFKEFLEEQIQAYRVHEQVKKDATTKPSTDKGKRTTTTFTPIESKRVGQVRAPVTAYTNWSTEVKVRFEIVYDKGGCSSSSVVVPESFVAAVMQAGYTHQETVWIFRLKLYTRTSMGNMYLYVDNTLQKFENARDILVEFGRRRLQKYKERREIILKQLADRLVVIRERVRFLEMVMRGELVVFRRPVDQLQVDLESMNFSKKQGSFDYLTGLPIHSFTQEKVGSLLLERQEVERVSAEASRKTAADLWLDELEQWKQTFVALQAKSVLADENQKLPAAGEIVGEEKIAKKQKINKA